MSYFGIDPSLYRVRAAARAQRLRELQARAAVWSQSTLVDAARVASAHGFRLAAAGTDLVLVAQPEPAPVSAPWTGQCPHCHAWQGVAADAVWGVTTAANGVRRMEVVCNSCSQYAHVFEPPASGS